MTNKPVQVQETDIEVIDAMERFGGSFVTALAAAYRKADLGNAAKLRRAFPEYWREYRDHAQHAMDAQAKMDRLRQTPPANES